MVNLGLEILLELLHHPQSGRAGQGVSLSEFRNDYNIPSTTFYRHMNTLIKKGVVVRVKRDSYKLSLGFTGRARDVYRSEINSDNMPF